MLGYSFWDILNCFMCCKHKRTDAVKLNGCEQHDSFAEMRFGEPRMGSEPRSAGSSSKLSVTIEEIGDSTQKIDNEQSGAISSCYAEESSIYGFSYSESELTDVVSDSLCSP